MKKWFNSPAFGLLVIRSVLGVMMIAHGVPMLLGGQSTLSQVGSAMALIGIDFAPLFWGVMAALSYIIGGSLYVIGFLFRPVSLVLCFNMILAVWSQLNKGTSFAKMSPAITLLCLFFGLLWIGPGKYSVDKE